MNDTNVQIGCKIETWPRGGQLGPFLYLVWFLCACLWIPATVLLHTMSGFVRVRLGTEMIVQTSPDIENRWTHMFILCVHPISRIFSRTELCKPYFKVCSADKETRSVSAPSASSSALPELHRVAETPLIVRFLQIEGVTPMKSVRTSV